MRIGAHVSIRGALHLAVDRAVAIGCECLQIFVGSPRQWRAVIYADQDVESFVRKRRASGLDPVVAHAAYLVNLAAPDPLVHRRSIAALTYAAQTMERLEGFAAITHVGSRLQSSWRDALRRVTTALTSTLAATSRTMILLENSVGAGRQVGATFEELRDIIAAMDWPRRLGICLDSAHLFANGWDLRTPRGVNDFVKTFDRTVGLQWLRAWHLNDSATPLGSHLDRHENIGEGAIGRRGFAALVRHPAFRHLPAFIETPGFEHDGPDRKNLVVLKHLRGSLLSPLPERRRRKPSRRRSATGPRRTKT